MVASGINLVMTVIGFAVSTMFIVFVCTRLICARIQLNASRRSFARASRSDLNTLERGLHGLEPLVVSNFPTRKYRELCFSSEENAQCTICLSDYQAEDTLRILPVCGHSFHATCIDIWLQQHSTCPVCRISLRGLPERRWFMQPMFSAAVRSPYGLQSINAHYCHCMANSNRGSFGSHTQQIIDPVQSETDGVAGEDDDSLCLNNDQITKDLGNRKVESPSNQ